MKWYPWLNQPYRNIIARHQQQQAHHALLVHAIDGMGDEALIWGVSRWLMCQQPDGLKSCGHCHGCQLMQAHTHPDWYRLEAEKGKVSLGIDAVRDVTEKLYHFAQQGGAKIVWLPDAAQLTEAAANALLKTLEEPPANCWFFLSAREPSQLLATLRSRCMTWHLPPPDETQGVSWLQHQVTQPDAVLRTALRLCNGAPGAALALLDPTRWQTRDALCEALNRALATDILQLLPVLNSDNAAERLSWLIALLVDAMKLQQGAGQWLTNSDRPEVVAQLAQQLNGSALHASVQLWMACRAQLLHVAALNRELILTDRLLMWGHLLSPAAVD